MAIEFHPRRDAGALSDGSGPADGAAEQRDGTAPGALAQGADGPPPLPVLGDPDLQPRSPPPPPPGSRSPQPRLPPAPPGPHGPPDGADSGYANSGRSARGLGDRGLGDRGPGGSGAGADDDLAPTSAPGDTTGAARRLARRRPAGPSRGRIAANDDGPSIGGLIYALEQKPSDKPFRYAAVASGLWTVIWLAFAAMMVMPHVRDGAGIIDVVTRSNGLLIVAAIFVPVSLFWFLAVLAWRTEELKLRSSTMTEVAIRLAEPDRMAEQSVASLGQAVRRQVSFMNDAVARALGRAGELEALVHNEVSALERSYEENERKIRGLIQELAGERHALVNTSERVSETLRGLGSEIPALIDRLSDQQIKLATIIDGAGQNLTALESAVVDTSRQLEATVTTTTDRLHTSISSSTGMLEHTLDGHASRLQSVLEDYTSALGVALDSRTSQMQDAFDAHATLIDDRFGSRVAEFDASLTTRSAEIDQTLTLRTAEIENALTSHSTEIETALTTRTQSLENVLDEYSRVLDTSMENRTQALDLQLVERTRALDEAFSERLKVFDDSILRSTLAIDGAISERAGALTNALEDHARNMSEIVGKQATELDETLMHGINSVRRSSESITRQSLKAIEGLAGQSEMLKNISENLLVQINNVTGRFEQQGGAIMKAATSLENANYRIDTTLQTRHAELNRTLDRLSGKADEFGEFLTGYSTSLEGSISDVQRRARTLSEEITRDTESRSLAALAEFERVRQSTDNEAQRTLADLRSKFTSVESEMSQHLGSLTHRVDETSEEVRMRARRAAEALEHEQARLRQQIDSLPQTAQASADAMRRSLQDQLKALDQLSGLALRQVHGRDVSPPVALQAMNLGAEPAPAAYAAPAMQQPEAPMPQSRDDRQRALSSLTSGLGKELAARHQHHQQAQPQPIGQQHGPHGPSHGQQHGPADGQHHDQPHAAPHPQQHGQPHPAPPHQMHQAHPGYAQPPQQAMPQPPVQTPAPQPAAPAAQTTPRAAAPQQGSGRDAWSLGDLLARASAEDEDGESGGPYAGGAMIELAQIASALDGATASAIWSRLRAGQRGVMVRSIYPAAGRETFDEVSRRYAADPNFRNTVDRYLADFERILRDIEQKDPSGRSAQGYAVSETGRVYLFLAHASGRLA